jgi:hypothetical protein
MVGDGPLDTALEVALDTACETVRDACRMHTKVHMTVNQFFANLSEMLGQNCHLIENNCTAAQENTLYVSRVHVKRGVSS